MKTRQLQAKQQNNTLTSKSITQKVQELRKTLFPKNSDKYSYKESMRHKNMVDNLLINKSMNFVAPDAAQFWNLFSNNFDTKGMEYVNQNGQIVPSIKNLPADWQEIVHKKVKQQTGLDDCVGVIFNENSSISKSIANSKSFENFIIDNFAELSLKGIITNKSMAFRIKDLNGANAIGRSDVPITILDNQGNLTTVILDTYDFNEGSINPAVQYVYNVQNSGLGLYYYSLIILKLNLLDLIFRI